MDTILKYPRTPHLLGSALQQGDDTPQARLDELANKYVVVEEKLDGANCGISFAADGRLLLQSRGHFLGGGPREAQWTLFKACRSRHCVRWLVNSTCPTIPRHTK